MMDQPQRLKTLRERSSMLRTIRDFFHRLDFVEVQTPTLSFDTMVDTTIDPISLKIEGFEHTAFLQTSPEFAMKRLLLEGMSSIYEITAAFRGSERGSLHNPEFTMLEWYRVGDSYQQGIKLLSDFGLEIFPNHKVECLTYEEAFQRKLGVNPHLADLKTLLQLVSQFDVSMPQGNVGKDDVLQILVSELIEPELGQKSLCILYDWPESQSALARTRDTEKGFKVAERFELYIDGVELANGYHELNDANEHLRRMKANNDVRRNTGLKELPVQSRLLSAMIQSPFPDCCGVAVGVDRLLMAKLGLKRIDQALSFDIENA